MIENIKGMNSLLDETLIKYVKIQDNHSAKVSKIAFFKSPNEEIMTQIEDELESLESLIDDEMENPDNYQSESWQRGEMYKLCKESYTYDLYDGVHLHFKGGKDHLIPILHQKSVPSGEKML